MTPGDMAPDDMTLGDMMLGDMMLDDMAREAAGSSATIAITNAVKMRRSCCNRPIPVGHHS